MHVLQSRLVSQVHLPVAHLNQGLKVPSLIVAKLSQLLAVLSFLNHALGTLRSLFQVLLKLKEKY